MSRNLYFAVALCVAVGTAHTAVGQTQAEGNGEATRQNGGGRSENGAPAAESPRRDDRNRGGDRRGRGGQRGGDARSAQGQPEAPAKTDPSATPKRPAARVGNKKTSAALTLPSQYASKDANKDGQVGMYEWSQTDLSTFRKLDLNGDGFLIPSELVNPGSRTGGGSTTSVATSTSPSAKAESATEKTGSSAGSTTPKAPASTPPADPLLAAAESNFTQWDKNQNGQLDQEEFDGTVRLERVFEKANLKFQGPMPKAKFLDVYVQAIKVKSK
ncbi:MAG: hypothetical protein JWM11_281 [Planctomycetaceae bacterium]|nr:hypothetical protein [Planctomycetaceae bacterium]